MSYSSFCFLLLPPFFLCVADPLHPMAAEILTVFTYGLLLVRLHIHGTQVLPARCPLPVTPHCTSWTYTFPSGPGFLQHLPER